MKTGRFFRQGRNVAALVCLLAIVAVGTVHAEVVYRATEPFSTVLHNSPATEPPYWPVYPCLPENIVLSGSMEVMVAITFDSNGGFHWKWQARPSKDIQAIGEESGRLYPYNGVGVTQDNVNLGQDAIGGWVYINNFRLIGKGDLPDIHVHQTLHLIIDDSGPDIEVIKVIVDNLRVTCH